MYGSRYLERQNFRPGAAAHLRILTGQELASWVANWVLTALVLVLFGKWITDTLTGLKLYPGDFLRAQELTSVGFRGTTHGKAHKSAHSHRRGPYPIRPEG